MDILEIILKNIELLIFLVFIIAQIIAVVAAQNKKKQHRRETAKPHPQPDAAPKTAAVTAASRQKSVQAPTRKKTNQPRAARQPIRSAYDDDCEWERSVLELEIKSAQKAALREAGRAEARNSETNAYAAQGEQRNLLTSQARDGFVWAEILQPPVSMR